MMCFDLVIFVAEKSPIIFLGAAKKSEERNESCDVTEWANAAPAVAIQKPGGWSRDGSKNIPGFLGESQTLLEEHEKQKPRKLFLFIASLIHQGTKKHTLEKLCIFLSLKKGCGIGILFNLYHCCIITKRSWV